MTQIVVLYHSGHGHTKYQAEAVHEGAISAGAEAHILSVDALTEEDEAEWALLDAADAIIFGSPTYMGSVSAPFKAFMDASSKNWMEQRWSNKIAAGFTNSGSLSGDKLNVLVQLSIFAAQHGMHWVNLGLLPSRPSAEDDTIKLNRMGGFLGAMAQTDHEADRPPKGDLETAKYLGARVAEVAARLQH